jgi:hypothetical protein
MDWLMETTGDAVAKSWTETPSITKIQTDCYFTLSSGVKMDV